MVATTKPGFILLRNKDTGFPEMVNLAYVTRFVLDKDTIYAYSNDNLNIPYEKEPNYLMDQLVALGVVAKVENRDRAEKQKETKTTENQVPENLKKFDK